jgi:stress response protein YsnF
MIVSILEEVLVVEKRLRLKEEIHIRKRRVETHQPQQVTLRYEEARIERLNNIEEQSIEK